ncbi:hypothetical protein [Lentzea sp. NBRC 102530]|uniref:hypothetical protein n=1 Tax=Lentzea sp. NBRC 102530 TaxID=3032201 RepID=UPI0024A523C1|nr:hypothetical protein [Lentzea sp. NBRC 102530]GLY47878.1 hypothetical protein Lesp01_15340 [Lentzea sp. NBRC 102530]
MTGARLVAALFALLAFGGACGANRSAPTNASLDVAQDWAQAFCGGYSPLLRAKLDLEKWSNSGPAALRTTAMNVATSGTKALTEIADEIAEIGPPNSTAEAEHERVIDALRSAADGYAAAERLIPGTPDDADAFRQVLDDQAGAADAQVLKEFLQFSKSSTYGKAFDEEPLCGPLKYLAES